MYDIILDRRGGVRVKPRCSTLLVAAVVFGIAGGCGGDGDGGGAPANHPPQLEAQRDTSVALGDTLELRARADDPDGHSITYGLIVPVSVEELHRGYAPDARLEADGYFWFVPDTEDQPSRSFRFTADDGFGGSDVEAFRVHITGR